MPIILFFLLLISSSLTHAFFPFLHHKKPFTIMLNPAGDAQQTGRTIDATFERSITLHYAEQLKEELEHRYPHVQVLLTRMQGKKTTHDQIAQYANRVPVDLYLSIHCYQESAAQPELTVYQFSYGNDFMTQHQELAFYSYDKAYLHSLPTTNNWGSLIKAELEREPYNKEYRCKGVYKLPLKSLIGIQAPAFALELGLKKATDATLYVEPVALSLSSLVNR